MNALSKVSMRAIPDARTDAHPAKTIALFCSFVLGASLCVESYDLDLSAGFS
jgi:hypothetical protein